jgi:1-deoxy-D-xylulose-5-phosphate synthase
MAAIDEPTLKAALEFMRTYEKGLSALRYPRDNVSLRLADQKCPPYELAKAHCLTPDVTDPDVAILAFGTLAMNALDAADAVKADTKVAVYDARFAKPVDKALIRALLEARTPIITIEDHTLPGGFGSAVLDAAAELSLDTTAITRLGLPDAWIHQNSRPQQLTEAGLDTPAIINAIRSRATITSS